ncbi:sulfotransferase family protein [Mangrovimonas aestuarii]|uniref:sulfotransferase family protein n=1 Tax=Mangrovimonas aestuarii TaxID=3018443 RepID=UPI002379EC30|nr:sulfotransferase [Mangrovimonas aestuarii]
MMKGQFFILGNARSGTSLLRLLLHHHSGLSVAPECGFLLWLYPKYNDWTFVDLNSKRLDVFIADVQASKKFETWAIDDTLLKTVIQKHSPDSYEALAQCVYLSYAEKQKKKPLYLGDKNNYYIRHLDQLDKVYSDKFIIHLVRDGRDVACSYRGVHLLSKDLKYLPQLPNAIDAIAHEWQQHNMSVYNHYSGYKRYILVRYEDLLLSPSSVLEIILAHFGMAYEASMVDFYKTNKLKVTEPLETLAWKQKTLQPIDPSAMGAYKTALNTDEIACFNAIAGSTLKLFNYAT